MRTDCLVGSLADDAGSLADDAEAALGVPLLLLERRARQLTYLGRLTEGDPVALPVASQEADLVRIVESRADLDRSVCAEKYQDPTGTVRILAPLDFYIALLYPKQLRFILIA